MKEERNEVRSWEERMKGGRKEERNERMKEKVRREGTKEFEKRTNE